MKQGEGTATEESSWSGGGVPAAQGVSEAHQLLLQSSRCLLCSPV